MSGSSFFSPAATPDGSNLLIAFPTATGRTYRLEHSDSLSSASWTDAGLPAIAGDGTVKSFTVPAAGPQRDFFRVIPSR